MQIYSTFLNRMSVMASIGIHPNERAGKQRIFVSAQLFMELDRSMADDIASVVDYDFLRHRISELVKARHFALQETLCQEIAAACLEEKKVLGVIVTTEKPDVYADAESVGCRIARFRSADIAEQARLYV
ncbi:MAG: dihydroneopterin aldolase [Alphaproteobacteria bacterium]